MAERQEVLLNPTLTLTFALHWSHRGRGPRTLTFRASERPELARFLLHAELDDDDLSVELTPDLVVELRKEGIIGDRDSLPENLEFNFDLPDDVAYSASSLQPYVNRINYDPVPSGRLVVNPQCYLQCGEHYPVAVAGRVPFAPIVRQDDEVLWVRDPGTEILAPYRISDWRSVAILRGLCGRDDESSSLMDLIRRLGDHDEDTLRRAHVLVPDDYVEARSKQWTMVCEDLRTTLRANDFVVIRGIFNPTQIHVMRRHYRTALELGHFSQRDDPAGKRIVAYNDPAARFLHHQQVALLNHIVPAPIKASYCYLAFYEPGAVLARHKDRPQCAWNLSVPLDASPETDRHDAWPIYVEVRGKAHEVRLELGDGILYPGTELFHWRDAQPAEHRTTVCFFHFVPEDFTGSLE